MASIRDDELPSSTGIPSSARRADWSAPPTLPVTEELLLALPKTDLHCHLDGSMRLKTILELAEQQKVKLPADTEDGLAKAIHMGEVCKNLEDYLVAFDVTLSVLQTAEALYRSAYELAREGTPLEGSELVVEEVPITAFCPACRVARAIASAQDLRCPDCGAPTPEILTGRELDVVALEIEP